MDQRLWDVYVPTDRADALAEGLRAQVKAIGGRVKRTTRARLKDQTRLHVALETPAGAEGIENVYSVVRWIASQGATVTGS